jgi:Protein of unknown function (DUF3680).
MAKAKLPKFRSLEEERSFWQSHDAFEVLGEEGWEVIEKGTRKRNLSICFVSGSTAHGYESLNLGFKRLGQKKGKKSGHG